MKKSNSNQISWEYNKGITLIALIITIIIMLILATVTIKISSQGGLFEYAGKATRETTITQEREQIQEAYVYASSNSLTGEVFAEDLQSELENNLGMNKTTTIGNGGNLRVLFLKTNNLYYVNSNGEVTKAKQAGQCKYCRPFLLRRLYIPHKFYLNRRRQAQHPAA